MGGPGHLRAPATMIDSLATAFGWSRGFIVIFMFISFPVRTGLVVLVVVGQMSRLFDEATAAIAG